jgi:thiamine biosynthesis lipoprotein
MEFYQQYKYVLGSDAYLTIVAPKSATLEKVFYKLWQTIDEFEKKFSRFLPTSELSNLNKRAGENVELSKEFIGLLKLTKQLSLNTKELFNPFILPSLQKAGYIGSWPNTNQKKAEINYLEREITDISLLHIGENWASIPKNSALDFGGIGKGYLLDLLAKLMPKQLNNFWFSIGGDLICRGSDVEGHDWKINIQDALNPKENIGFISNQKGQQLAVATSGITKRKGHYNKKKWHHIIDPKSTKPAITDVLTATVSTESGATADVYAKCLVIIGSKKAPNFIQQNKIQAAALQVSQKSAKLSVVMFGEIQK